MNSIESINHFRSIIKACVEESGLGPVWYSEKSTHLVNIISQKNLDNAFESQKLIQEIFKSLGEISYRPTPKSYDRVKEKISQLPENNLNYFRVLSDFVACRLNCKVNDIQTNIEEIKKIVENHGGILQIKDANNDLPYGRFISKEGQYLDITQFVYIFMKNVGYPIEIQIGHPFASHTFSLDSELRNNKTSSKIDLWTNNFYLDVRKVILDQSNRPSENFKDEKEELFRKAKLIHPNEVLPKDLEKILNDL